MSAVIDERIVEMRFDNQQFERNVQTSLTSLDKLKQGLDLDGAAKGMEGLGDAAKKCDLSTLSSSAEVVLAKFSALEVMAMTALSNITNSAVNAGKRMISSFTIEPISTGFSEYELKMGSIQTIMASTGESLDKVNQKLDELNTYSDRTIYSFSDMTQNIGKFTNAGVKLNDAVAAIQGVSNVAAVSGANANEASRAMYNFAQALSAGYVKLIDWKSIENANMATVEFKTQLLESAVAAGTLTRTTDGMYKTIAKGTVIDATHMFNDSLQEQWMTTEVLTSTLKDYADETTEIGKKAFAAAQDVKTFSQLLDTLKESAQSGWAETWQLIVGDYEEAKATLREFSEFFSSIIDGSSKARNALLGGAMTSSWGQLKNEVSDAGVSVDAFCDALRETASESVDGLDRMIEEAGSFDATLSKGWLTTDILSRTLDNLANAATGTTEGIAALSDEQLKNAGYTEEQIESLRSLSSQASSSTGEIAKLVRNMTRQSGRELLFDSLLNGAKAIQKVFGTLKGAWDEVFPPVTSEQLYSLIEGLNKFTQKLILSDETADKIGRTFKGLFAVLDIIRQGFSAIFKAVSPLLGGLGALSGGILDITASFGDWLVGIDEAAKKGDVFNRACQRISGFVGAVVSKVKEFIQTVKEDFKIPGFEGFQKLLGHAQEHISRVVGAIADMGGAVTGSVDEMGSAVSGSKFIQGLQKLYNGAKGICEGLLKVIGGLASGVVDKLSNANFSEVLDLLNGLSFGAIAVGLNKFLNTGIEDLLPFDGILDGIKETLEGTRSSLEAWQSSLQSTTLLKLASAIAILAGSLVVLASIDSEKLTTSLMGLGVLFGELTASMAILGKLEIDGKAMGKTGSAMIKISLSLLVLTNALKTIAQLEPEQMTAGLIGIGVLLTEIDLFMNTVKFDKKASKTATGMILFAASVKILASAVTTMGGLDLSQLAKGLTGVGVLLAEIDVFLNTARFSGKSVLTAAGVVVLAGAIKILASACNDFGEMSWDKIAKGLTSIGALLLEITAFTKLTGNAKSVVSTGLALIEIAAAMKIFASAINDFASMSWEQIAKGLTAMGVALAEVAVAMNVMPANTAVVGAGLVLVGAAMEIVADSLIKMGKMQWEQIAKGLVAMGGAIAELAIGLKVMNGTLAGSAAMLVAAGALAVLTPVLVILGSMSWESIAKGLITIAGAFAVLGVAGTVLTPLVPTILGLSAAIALFGAGVLGIGAGILLIGSGLSAIAVGITAVATSVGAGAAIIVAGLVSIITGIAAMIPVVAEKLGEAIIAFAKVITDGAPAIGEAVKALVSTLVDCVPAIADGALELLSSVLDALVAHTPQLVDALMQFLIELLNGISRNLPTLIQSAVDLLMSFFSGIVSALSGIDTDALLKGIAGIGLLTGIFVALGALAGLIPGAMAGVLGLGVLIAELGLVLAAVGALSQIPGLEWLIGEGGKLLESIGTAIGGFVGSIASGFMTQVSSSFPQIGADLSAFMTNAKPFIDGASSITPDMFAGVKALTDVILLLTAADILNGLTSWLTGGSSLSDFAKQLVPFGVAMQSYSMAVKGISMDAVNNSAAAGKALVELADTVPNCGGLIGFFTGNNNISDFGNDLVLFGSDLAGYAEAVKNVKPDAVTASANAAQALSNLAKGLPDSSLLDQWFGGDQTLASFGDDIASFGADLEDFYSNISGVAPSKLSGVITQVRELADLAKDVKGIDKNAFSNLSKSLTSLADAGIDGFTNAFSNCSQKVNSAVLSMLNSFKASVSSNKSAANPAMEEVMGSLASVVNEKTASMNTAVVQMMSRFSKIISNNSNAVRSAMKTVLSDTVAAINGSVGSFNEAGKNVGQGFVNGIISKMNASSAAGRNLGLAALNAAKKALDSHSPSREFIHLGENIGEGLAIGVKNSIVPASQATSGMIGKVLKVSSKGIKAFKEWAEEKKYYGELSLKDELAGYEKLQKKYKAGSKERKEIDREVYRLQNELVAATYQASMDWIEEEKYYNRLSLEEELAAYERVQARYLEGSEERKKADREVYRLRNELESASYQASLDWIEEEKYYNRLSLKEELAAYEQIQERYLEGSEERKKADREVYRLRNELASASYQESLDWIEEEKYYNRMTLSDELAAYKRVQSRYAKGTAERKKMDREVYRLEKEISEAQTQYITNVQKVQSETNQKRLELEQEYADKVQSINDKLAQDIQAANDQYENALKSRADSLYQSYGLFDEVKEREEVSGDTLMKNLEGQVKEFGEWQDILDKLSARGLDSELVEELQQMGPDAISQIKALNSMTDSELEKYAALWSIKHAQAREQAVSELEGLRIETQNNIVQLRADADRELEEYRSVWQSKMDQVTADADAELETLRKEFAEKVGIIKKNTESDLKEMSETAQKILREAGWDETGKQIVTGLTEGVQSERSSFIGELTNMALAGVEAVKTTLDINSPSRVFRELGVYTGLGFVNGLNGYADKSYYAGANMAESVKDGLSKAISSIDNLINGDMDMQPTIRPVLDLSDVVKGTGELDGLFLPLRSIGLVSQANASFNASAAVGGAGITVQNDDVVAELRSLRGEMSAMTERLERMQVVLDTGALVGGMAGPMDAALGQMAIRKGRGN